LNLPSLERWLVSMFQSDAEATNFSAHVAWSLLVPLIGYAIGGRKHGLQLGAIWIAYSLFNELLLHGPTDVREFALNLISRLVPSAVVMTVLLIAVCFSR